MAASFLQTVIGYLYYAGWIAVAASLAYSAYLFARGDSQNGKRFLIGVIAAAFLLGFGYQVITSAINSKLTYNYQYAEALVVLGYSAAAIAIAGAAIYFAAGHVEKGIGYFLAAALLIFAVNFGPAILAVTPQQQVGATVNIVATPQAAVVPFTAKISGSITPAPPPNTEVNITSTSNSSRYIQYTGCQGQNVRCYGTKEFSQIVYTNQQGDFSGVKIPFSTNGTYVVTATEVSNPNVTGSTIVDAINPESCSGGGFGFIVCTIVSYIGDAINAVSLPFLNGFFSQSFQFFVSMPTMNAKGAYAFNIISPQMQAVYDYSKDIALSLIGGFFALDVAWKVWENEGERISDTVVSLGRDLIIAAAVIFAIPLFYNAFALLINQISYSILSISPTGGILTHAFTLIAAGLFSGYFVPELATFGADLLFAIVLAYALAFVRFVVIGSAVALAPISVVFWLFPPFRKVVTFFAELVLGLAIGGIFAATILVMIASVVNMDPTGTSIIVGFMSPVIIMIIPELIAFGVMGTIPGMGGFSSTLERARGSRMSGAGGGGGGGGGKSKGNIIEQTPAVPEDAATIKTITGRKIVSHRSGMGIKESFKGGFKTTSEGGGLPFHYLFKSDFMNMQDQSKKAKIARFAGGVAGGLAHHGAKLAGRDIGQKYKPEGKNDKPKKEERPGQQD